MLDTYYAQIMHKLTVQIKSVHKIIIEDYSITHNQVFIICRYILTQWVVQPGQYPAYSQFVHQPDLQVEEVFRHRCSRYSDVWEV